MVFIIVLCFVLTLIDLRQKCGRQSLAAIMNGLYQFFALYIKRSLLCFLALFRCSSQKRTLLVIQEMCAVSW